MFNSSFPTLIKEQNQVPILVNEFLENESLVASENTRTEGNNLNNSID